LNILWAITGSGAYIRDTVHLIYELKKVYDLKITTVLSKWGYEVARIYGVVDILRKISSGGYYEELLIGDQGMYFIGRLNLGRYKLVIIAPASSNTVAKIVHGIADTPPTLAFAEAIKSNVPVIIFPTDFPGPNGYMYSETPCYIDRSLCKCFQELGICSAMEICPVNAIVLIDNTIPRIDLSRCIGCEKCIEACRYGAIKCWERIRLKPRDLDLENIEQLSMQKGVYVVKTINELRDKVVELIGEGIGQSFRNRSRN